MIFQRVDSSSGLWEPILAAQGADWDPALDGMPFHLGALTFPTAGDAHWSQGTSHAYILGVWEETSVPGKNPHGHGEKVQTPHRV